MVRRTAAGYFLAVVLALGLIVPSAASAAGRTLASGSSPRLAADSAASSVVPAANSALELLPGTGDLGDIVGPGPHFGYSGSVLMALATNIPVPPANLQLLKIIPITGPTVAWTPANASSDILSFDPVRRIMYVTDRPNNGVQAIDTTTDTVIGLIPVPPCADYNANGGAGPQCPSGVVVAPDLRKLVVTDRIQNPTPTNPIPVSRIWIYDISATPIPQAPIASPAMGQGALAGDELDYDPANRRAYVANTGGQFFITVVDLVTNTLLGQIPMAAAGEQPRFNPVDGMVYHVVSGNNTVVRIDPTVDGFGAVVLSVPRPECGPSDTLRGLDIDPRTNVGLLGCARTSATSGNPQLLIDMASLNLIAQFPQVQAVDVLAFNRNTRRWYEGSSNNTNAGTPGNPGCPSDVTRTSFPWVGVFDAGPPGNPAGVTVTAACSGRGAHSLWVDPIGNKVYVPAPQFPADPNSGTTGQAGVLVFRDPTPSQVPQGLSSVTLGSNGTVTFTPSGTGATAQGTLTGLTGPGPFRLVVPTSVGNEVVICTVSGTTATCSGTLIGTPIQGATALLVTSSGVIVARGTIVAGAPSPAGTTTPTLTPTATPHAVIHPALLPPPLPPLIPPLVLPPPPLLPPPPSAPMGAAPAGAAFPEVPVIPEADSVVLLVGGLAAVGVLAGLRARRRRGR
jgi:YVTN family beta-propeller protein